MMPRLQVAKQPRLGLGFLGFCRVLLGTVDRHVWRLVNLGDSMGTG
jgi:hypothetical protein